jgi:hypothetical protein
LKPQDEKNGFEKNRKHFNHFQFKFYSKLNAMPRIFRPLDQFLIGNLWHMSKAALTGGLPAGDLLQNLHASV